MRLIAKRPAEITVRLSRRATLKVRNLQRKLGPTGNYLVQLPIEFLECRSKNFMTVDDRLHAPFEEIDRQWSRYANRRRHVEGGTIRPYLREIPKSRLTDARRQLKYFNCIWIALRVQ